MREMSFTVGGTGEVLESTLISIVPFPIREFKPGLVPGIFEIPASVDGKPQFKVIGQSMHHVYIDAERGNLPVIDPSYDVADAIVADYNSAQLESEPGAHPGLFWVLGNWNADKVKKDPRVAEKLDEIREIQNNWFQKLVVLGDDDWQRHRQHTAISDIQRVAAKTLDPENKRGREWIFVNNTQQTQMDEMKSMICPACGSDIINTAIICRYCKLIIDQKRYAEMKFAGHVEDGAALNLNQVMAGLNK